MLFFLFFLTGINKEKKNTTKLHFASYLIIVIYFMNFMNFDFVFKFFLLRSKKIYTLKLIVALNFSLLRHDICFPSFLPSFFKAALHSTNVSRAIDSIRWEMGFFWQSYRLEKLINKILTKRNLSHVFLIHFTFYLYLWWSLYS